MEALTDVVFVTLKGNWFVAERHMTARGLRAVCDAITQDAVEPRIQVFVIRELIDCPRSACKGILKDLVGKVRVAHPPTNEGSEAIQVVRQMFQTQMQFRIALGREASRPNAWVGFQGKSICRRWCDIINNGTS